MRNNFTIIFFTLVCFFLLLNLSVIAQQDSIPKVKPIATGQPATPPTKVGENNNAIANPINNNNNSNNTVESSNTTFPSTNQPKRVEFVEKPDPELIAAMSNNPFALIRDGKPKVSKPRKETLPTSPINSEKNRKKNIEKEIDEITNFSEEAFVPIDTSTAALNQQNPFRLEGTPAERKSGFATKKIKFNPKAGSGSKRTTSSTFNPIFDTSKVDVNPLNTLKFSLSILLLGFLAIIMTRFPSEVKDIYKAFLNQNLMSLLYREKGTILRLPYILLYALATLSVGTMIFLTTNLFGIKIFDSNFSSLIACITGIGGIYLGRHTILFFSIQKRN
jgi:hypothetical protein